MISLLSIWSSLKVLGSSSRANSPEHKACGPRCAAQTRCHYWAPETRNPARPLCLVPMGGRAGPFREHESRSVCPMMCLAKGRIQKQHENMHTGVMQIDSSLPRRILHWWKFLSTGEGFEKQLLPPGALCSGETHQLLKWNTRKGFFKMVFQQHGNILWEINAKSIQAHNLHLPCYPEWLSLITGNLWT